MGSKGDEEVDIVVVGGGVVGCAVFHRLSFTYPSLRILLIEKERTLLSEASSGNSGIFHTGFDAPPSSIEARCMTRGCDLMYELLQYSPPFLFRSCGALLVAWTPEEVNQLDSIIFKAKQNGVDVERLEQDEIYNKEPQLSRNPPALGAIWISRECVVDPFAFPLSLALIAMYKHSNHRIKLNTELINAFHQSDSSWVINCRSGSFQSTIKYHTNILINCAGNFGDLIHEKIWGQTPFHILPRKGQFVVYQRSTSHQPHPIILPVPTSRTKGVLVWESVFGNLFVGPTAEDQTHRTQIDLVPETLMSLQHQGEKILPILRQHKRRAAYAGLRPASEHRDYQIIFQNHDHYLCIGSIRSTGLTACLGIAEYVLEMIASSGLLQEKGEPFDFAIQDWNSLQLHYQIVEPQVETRFPTIKLPQCVLSSSFGGKHDMKWDVPHWLCRIGLDPPLASI